jgi:hypothetical protein
MSETNKGQLGYSIAGIIFLAIGSAVFAIRLLHAGPYALPGGAAFIGALLAIGLGAYLLWPGKPRFTGLVAIVVATFALYAVGPESNLVDLRLWIVDRSDGAWVGMGRSKAVTHNLDGARLDMLRGGETICVIPALVEDRATVSEIHKMKVDKYKAAQISASIGMYPTEASENTVALRLDPCNS